MGFKTQRLILLGFVGIAASLFLFRSHTHAQTQPFNLITSPLPIDLVTKPGQTVSADLRVKNNSVGPEKLQVNLYKFSVDTNSKVSLSDKQPGDDFMNWVKFEPQTFTAEPNVWKTVKMTINPPKDAALGYYYAVGFSRAGQPKPVPGGAAIKGQVITFVLLDVDVPGAKRELKVTEFSADKSTYEFLPATFTVKVKNTGNVHVVPSGTIFIKRGGKTVATLPINPGQGNVLPNSTRTFTATWADGFPVYVPKIKDGKPVSNKDTTTAMTLKWDFSQVPKLRAGKYSAKLLLVYDDGKRDVPVEGNVSFWVMPLRIIGAILIVGVLVSIGLWSISKKVFKAGKKLKQPKSD